jgi:prephenate dehydrogenase
MGSTERSEGELPPYHSVAVIGLGLMGGSLARALRALANAPEVIGYSPVEAERVAALAAGAVSRVAERADDAAAGAELVVYAAPLSATLDLMQRHRSVWRSDAVVSDLCSLKAAPGTQARVLGIESRYVGAHPMTGSESSGFAASRSGLYREAVVWLSASEAARGERARAERFWELLGARPRWIDPETHDRLMVRASHLPQLLSNLLADALSQAGLGPGDVGPGGRDMTRLAGSSPALWRDLLASSAPELAKVLRELGASVEDAASALERGDLDALERLMERTRSWKSGERHGDA